MAALIKVTRKQARAVLDLIPKDTKETGTFFSKLFLELDCEQAVEPDDRTNIVIQTTGVEM